MSVEEARRAVLFTVYGTDCISELNDPLDRLILEVQAEMPCYRVPWLDMRRHPESIDIWTRCVSETGIRQVPYDGDVDMICPSCAARAKLAPVPV